MRSVFRLRADTHKQKAKSDASQMLKCYIINLDRDAQRLVNIESRLKKYPFIHAVRVAATSGSELSDLVCEILTNKPEMRKYKGTVGCTMSHISAWETMVRNDDNQAIIFEDDAQPVGLEALAELSLPAGIDIAFCNSRTAYGSGSDRFLPFFPALNFIMTNKTSVGGDGYILSRNGAEKLLSLFRVDRLYSHVDLRLAAYAIRRDDLVKLPPNAHIIKDICTLRRLYPEAHHIAATILGVSLTDHVKDAPSTRTAEDQRRAAREK
jgi:GR25 family glycosyltransferase involved in LPS biosynthesis